MVFKQLRDAGERGNLLPLRGGATGLKCPFPRSSFGAGLLEEIEEIHMKFWLQFLIYDNTSQNS